VRCLFFCLYNVVILIFIDASAMLGPGLASGDACLKDSGHEDVHTEEQLTTDGSATA
jgi:hypothetical protein